MRYSSDRASNFELLRLLSMFLIVFYHLLRWFVQDNPAYDWVRAFWLPLHVGVVCFILISGYFRIRPSSRGLLLLLGILFVYSLPNIVSGIKQAGSAYDILHSLQFVSRSEFWFVKVYVALYLLSPLLNSFFEHSSLRGQWYLLGVFALLTVYYGYFAEEISYSEGKNVLYFMLIYQVGHLLQVYSSKWKAMKMNRLVGGYLLFNVLLVVLFLLTRGSWMGDLIWKLSFPYNSPVLILNAAWLFVIFGRMEFHSLSVNRLAGHCFAIYLIHGLPLLIDTVERPVIQGIFHLTGDKLLATIPLLFVLACLIMVICIAIDSLFRPLWKVIDHRGRVLQESLGF